MPGLKGVCVFCGSSTGSLPSFDDASLSRWAPDWLNDTRVDLRRHLDRTHGADADAASAAGGRVTGVITESLSDHEIAHGGLARLDVVRTMDERKARMAALSDAFVMLLGGFGRFEGIHGDGHMAQLAIHENPVGILNVDGYFACLVAFVAHAVEMGFHPAAQRGPDRSL